MNPPDGDRRAEESRRILDRVSREADSSVLGRASAGLRDHITAKDGEAEDRIDRLGTRIGRSLGLILTAALFIWLVVFLIRGG